MGLTQDKALGDYYGVRIEVEANGGLTSCTYRLIIDNEKHDEIRGYIGEHTLRGKLTKDGTALPVQVVIKQGWFGTKYKLLVDGREHPLQKTK